MSCYQAPVASGSAGRNCLRIKSEDSSADKTPMQFASSTNPDISRWRGITETKPDNADSGKLGPASVFGEATWVRATVGSLYAITLISYLRVLQRLTVSGIGLEDTPVWTSAFRIVLRGNGAKVYDPATQIASMQPWIPGAGPDKAPLWAFPPTHTFALSPLGVLSPFQLYSLLTVVSAFLWCWTARSLMRWVASRPIPWSPNATALLGATAVGFTPAMGTIRYGSFSVIVLASLWAGLRRTLSDSSPRDSMYTDRFGAASNRGVVTGLAWAAAALKPQMIIFTMIAALRRRTLPVVGAALTVAVSSLVIAVVAGPALRPTLLADWVSVSATYGSKAPGAAMSRMWTVRGVLTSLLGTDSGVVAGVAGAAFLGGLALLVGLGWRSVTTARLAATFAVALCLQCTVFPYQSSYDTVLLVPAVVLAIDAGRRHAPRLCRTLGFVAVISTLLVFSPAWEERLPGLGWAFAAPAMLVWLVTSLVVWIALIVHRKAGALEASVGVR